MRAIVVGSGWGRHAAEVLAGSPGVRLEAIVARGSARSRALAQTLGVELRTDLAAAIRRIRPDLACVSVGEDENEALVKPLLDAGCHVLCSHPVARTADAVSRLARVASSRGVLAVTDYTLGTAPRFAAFARARIDAGELLRLTIEYPGRLLPMALDLALRAAGPADACSVSHRYPKSTASARARSRAAFPPTVILEHTSGAVSALTPIPHSDPARAFRVVASTVTARITCELPSGATTIERLVRGGHLRRETAHEPDPAGSAEAFGALMRDLVGAFVSAASGEARVLPTFDEEARIRVLWRAIWLGEESCAPLDPG